MLREKCEFETLKNLFNGEKKGVSDIGEFEPFNLIIYLAFESSDLSV